MLSTRQLAERWGVSDDHVLTLIHRGELHAIDLAIRGNGRHRPTWRIPLAEVEALEQRRTQQSRPRVQRAKRLAVPRYV